MEIAFRLRLYLLTALILLGFGTLLQRLHKVQIEDQSKYRERVPSPRSVTVREPGVRGEIRDANGIVLARNSRQYEVTFNLEEIVNHYLTIHEQAPMAETLRNERGMPRKGKKRDILRIVNEVVLTRLKAEGLSKQLNPRALEIHYATHGGMVPFSYSTDLNFEKFARFAALSQELPGISVGLNPQRQYPFNAHACHILGFTQNWMNGAIPEEARKKYHHYIGDEKGITGIEATMDHHLVGIGGEKTVLKDEKGRTMSTTDYIKPQSGADVILSIDSRVQFLVENTLRNAGRAAAVVMNVQTGEVIAMASVPNYNPNTYIPPTQAAKLEEYSKNICLPTMNRCIENFDPGSTFKLATALAGVRAGMANRIISCDGYVQYGNHKAGCWIWNQNQQHGSHGSLNLSKAIQVSCNPYFYRLANSVGPKAMAESFHMLNLGHTTGIELPGEKPGSVIGTPLWKQKNPTVTITPVDLAFLAIGQGTNSATPLQLCSMVAAIANGGRYYQPRLVKKVSRGSHVIVADEPILKCSLLENGISAENLELIRKGMWMAVNQPGGTAGRVKMPNIEIAAKTGTAQSVDRGVKSNNSWTVSFAPFDNPKYAICVLVIGGTSGGKVCGPLTHLIYRGLFALDDGLTVKVTPQQEYVGNTNKIEEIALPEDTLAAVGAVAMNEPTETADNIATDPNTPSPDTLTPENSQQPQLITPTIDPTGTIPRAIPVTD
jgi:penicillin-binding protein 2